MLQPSVARSGKRDQAYWKSECARVGALRICDGNVESPDAGGNFNSPPFIADQQLMTAASEDLVAALVTAKQGLKHVTCVVEIRDGTLSPGLAKMIAEEIGCRRGYLCMYASLSGEGAGETGKIVFDEPNPFLPGNNVLLCIDEITAGESIARAVQAIDEQGGIFLPFVLCLFNRSGMKETGGKRIISLIDASLLF